MNSPIVELLYGIHRNDIHCQKTFILGAFLQFFDTIEVYE
jgi:hypothetical protein